MRYGTPGPLKRDPGPKVQGPRDHGPRVQGPKAKGPRDLESSSTPYESSSTPYAPVGTVADIIYI